MKKEQEQKEYRTRVHTMDTSQYTAMDVDHLMSLSDFDEDMRVDPLTTTERINQQLQEEKADRDRRNKENEAKKRKEEEEQEARRTEGAPLSGEEKKDEQKA